MKVVFDENFFDEIDHFHPNFDESVPNPKFRSFSSLSRHRFAVSVSLWGSSRGILVVFEAPGRSNL